MRIVALDPATKTGFADSDGPSGTFDLSVKRDESGGMRLIRLRSKLRALCDPPPNLLVFEAARNAGPKTQGALVTQAELQGVIKLFCEDHDIEYRGYSPSEIKKYATGNGGCSKLAMMMAADKRWPGEMFADDNEVDARFLLEMAKEEYAG